MSAVPVAAGRFRMFFPTNPLRERRGPVQFGDL